MEGPMTVTLQLVEIVVASIFIAVGIVIWIQTRFSSLWRDFDAYRLHVSETYATKASVNVGFDKLQASVEKLDTKLDALIMRAKDEA